MIIHTTSSRHHLTIRVDFDPLVLSASITHSYRYILLTRPSRPTRETYLLTHSLTSIAITMTEEKDNENEIGKNCDSAQDDVSSKNMNSKSNSRSGDAKGNSNNNSNAQANTNTDKTKELPRMCLEECHKFHTNPALSSIQHHHAAPSLNTENVDTAGDGTDTPAAAVGGGINTNTNTSTNTGTGTHANVLNKAIKRKQRLAHYKAQTSGSSSVPTASTEAAWGLGSPCRAIWATNSNYCKNAELLAIASPLNLNSVASALAASASASASASGSSSGTTPNNQSNNQTAGNTTHNSGSNVFILVFDEGTFAHSGEFNLSDELCELFGLPTQPMSMSDHQKRSRCGLRRTVFHNSNLKDSTTINNEQDDADMNNERKANNIANDNNNEEEQQHQSSSATSQIHEKAHSLRTFYRNLSTKCLQPFAAHVWKEMGNCKLMFEYEVFDDGRIFGSKAKRTKAAKTRTPAAAVAAAESSGKSDSSPCLIRPQLVFHVNLPYSNTFMEVTGLEWNNDGTTLSIIQRRKGSPNTFPIVPPANKKKKASLNAVVAPGNTAVSFWSIPEWLHVACDEMKMVDEDEDLRYESDGIIIKANNTVEDSIGWEVGRVDENKSLFPLWEWYLAKYIFNDETEPADTSEKGRRSRIMIKNCMEYTAYPLELSATSASTPATRNGKKSVVRSNTTDNANAIMNGDVTCLIWEESPILKLPASEEEKEDGEEENDKTKESGKNSTDKSQSNDSKKAKDKRDFLVPASKWVALGTSKGQMILHNGAASYISHQNKKACRKAGADSSKNTFANIAADISPLGRTVVIPLRHKKRITCGAWVDNLLVFGHVSTGCLTLVSTFPKSELDDDGNAISSKKVDTFAEKTVKVLGSMPLPGGRDAVNIHIGNVEDDIGKVTILSVNCEGKSLLFYTFPKFLDSTNINALASNITSSPAMEVHFSLTSSSDAIQSPTKGSASCGNIVFHYLIPNTLLVLVAFSSGYFALVDWVNGVILSDADIARQAYCSANGLDATVILDAQDIPRENHDNFLLDVAYHVSTSTLACLTQDGNVVVYHIRILDGCNDVKAGDCICTTGLTISTKTHTRPKTKTWSQHDNFVFDCDSSVKRILGTIAFLCTHTISNKPTVPPDVRRGDLINFSADGECISVSLGDESVAILSINVDDAESDRLKQRLAESIYLGRDNMMMTFVFIIVCVAIVWYKGKGGEATYLKYEYSDWQN